MTITAIDPFSDGAVYGYVQAALPDTQTLNTILFPVSSLVQEDLNTTPFPPDPSVPNIWIVVWFISAYIKSVIGNPSKFKSALPKFDLGSIAHIYRGHCSSEYYLNYNSQRLPAQLCWSPDSSVLYPQPYVPPQMITGQLLSLTTSGTIGTATMFADSCSILLTNGSVEDAQIVAYYQALNLNTNLPLSLGDI